MKHDQITLERLKKANKTFFSEEALKFHGDKGYKILRYMGRDILEVKTDRTNVYYEITKNFGLKYTTLLTAKDFN